MYVDHICVSLYINRRYLYNNSTEFSFLYLCWDFLLLIYFIIQRGTIKAEAEPRCILVFIVQSGHACSSIA